MKTNYLNYIRLAKQMKKRIWKDYEPSTPSVAIDNKEFTGKVQYRNAYITNNTSFIQIFH